jgi:hypothetical protein
MKVDFNKKQQIAILLSPILFVIMFAVYQGFAILLGKDLGWYAGFAIYWPIFCLLIPLLLVGSGQIIERYKIIKINPKYLLVYLFPVFMTLIGSVFMSTAERDIRGLIIWLGMSIGNGVFEEFFGEEYILHCFLTANCLVLLGRLYGFQSGILHQDHCHKTSNH